MPREIARTEMTLVDDWGEHFAVYGGQTITALVVAQPAEVQLSASQPPNPPLWSQAITLPPGEYSRARPFGYVRFRNGKPGAPSQVSFWAYAD